MLSVTCTRMVAAALLFATGCGEQLEPGVTARMSFEEGAGFFDAPFPNDLRARSDGSLAVADFPNPAANLLVDQLTSMLEEGHDGFSLNGAVFLPFDGAIDATRLPVDASASLAPEAQVYMVDVTPGSDARGRRIPIELSFKREAEILSPPNLLVALPFQGVVLAPRSRYALVVRRALGDEEGRALFVPEALADMFAGLPPRGARGAEVLSSFADLGAWLTEQGIPTTDIAAAAVFTTGDPLAELARFRDDVAARPAAAPTSPTHQDTYDEYCVISVAASLPVFQRGPKPYAEPPSGQIAVDIDGRLVEEERDVVELIVTIPRVVMPAAGYPLVLYAAGAEGRARQVVDRTAASADPEQGLGPPGQGPAKYYAARGIAALGFPAPLAWERNPSRDGGLLDFWNVANLAAFRGNLRQGILDFATLVEIAAQIRIAASLCPGASSADGMLRYDPDQLVLHGHSTGSTIGSAAIALEPSLRGAVLSGAGGSWIYKLVLAEAPLQMKTVAGVLLGILPPEEVDLFDPVVTLFQTALESVEVMNWGRATILEPLPERTPRDVLLIEGVVDSYHFPRMVNAYAMSVGLDLVEPAVEPTAAEDYALVGRTTRAPPVTANVEIGGKSLTAATVQAAQNDQDGHYVAFELDEVKYRYACFVSSLVTNGLGAVPLANGDALAPCP